MCAGSWVCMECMYENVCVCVHACEHAHSCVQTHGCIQSVCVSMCVSVYVCVCEPGSLKTALSQMLFLEVVPRCFGGLSLSQPVLVDPARLMPGSPGYASPVLGLQVCASSTHFLF